MLEPWDMHVHVRQGEMLDAVLPFTSNICAGALFMPNTKPPIATGDDALRYKSEIMKVINDPQFTPIVAIKMLPTTTPETIYDAHEKGLKVVKLYPKGVTTHSDDGIDDYVKLMPVLKAMEEVGMVLSIHGELPSTPNVFTWERNFQNVASLLLSKFPDLRIVLEHITLGETAFFVSDMSKKGCKIAATITAHHLASDVDDMLAYGLNPALYCKPILKFPKDKWDLRDAAMSGEECFFFGSDSAPHTAETKYCECGCAGAFTAPFAIPLLAKIFYEADKIEMLENFTSVFGPKFYGFEPSSFNVILSQQKNIVPEFYQLTQNIKVVPPYGGIDLGWQVYGVDVVWNQI